MANPGRYVLGVAGLAVYRTWLLDPPAADARTEDVARLLTDAPSMPFDAPALDVVDGYARWASSYDATPNPLIDIEGPLVRAMIDGVPPGIAVDAACGTGRHVRHLAERGHRVIGIDASPAMLAEARRAVPSGDFRTGDLGSLPVPTATADVVVSTLALSHCPDVGPAIAELARVARPGARVVVSDFHPVMIALGGSAFFVAADGTAGHVRSFCHWHGEYLAAFAAVGLDVVRCVEPAIAPEHLPGLSGGFLHLAPDAFRDALVGLPLAVVWELVRRPSG